MFRLAAITATAMVGSIALPATAQTSPATQTAPVAQTAPAPAPVEKASAPASDVAFGGASAMSEGDLKATTGREDLGTMASIANQRSTVSNNSVTGTSVTGNVQIDGQAFQNLQGLAVINANSGNNVAINSAMNVTVNMAPR